MKKIILGSLLVAALSFTFTSCLKDKGYDNFEYGINDADTQPPGVGFPRGAAAKYAIGINFQTTTQNVDGVLFVNLESGTPASSDVTITLIDNSATLRNAYNTANGTSISALATNLYSAPLTVTIPAGQRFGEVPITFPNSSLLSLTQTYGIGFTIASVSGGYKIADNLKNLFIEVALKNKYDGLYQLNGVHNRSPYLFNFETDVEMRTTGASSVAMYWIAGGDFGQPIGVAPGSVNWYGNAVSPNFTFDPATDLCTGVGLQVGNAVTLAMVTLDNTPDANPDGPIVNRYEAATKKMYLSFQYNNNNLRRFYDTLTYKGPR